MKCHKGFIKVAELLQALGKACPFTEPGLWEVSKKEVSPLAWRQLMRLVGECQIHPDKNLSQEIHFRSTTCLRKCADTYAITYATTCVFT